MVMTIFSLGVRDEYYAWGLNQIAKAVSFLNSDCKLVSVIYLYSEFYFWELSKGYYTAVCITLYVWE